MMKIGITNWNLLITTPLAAYFIRFWYISNKLTKIITNVVKIFDHLFIFKEEKKEGEEDKPKVEDVGEDEDEDKADKDKKKKKTIKVWKVHIFWKVH